MAAVTRVPGLIVQSGENTPVSNPPLTTGSAAWTAGVIAPRVRMAAKSDHFEGERRIRTHVP